LRVEASWEVSPREDTTTSPSSRSSDLDPIVA
jgi:hypothetical protein